MTFKFIHKAGDSQVRRTFACDDCHIEWNQWMERDAALPDCPVCVAKAQAAVTSPAILTTKSQAIDIAQAAMEDMGYTDFNDNQRAGDIAVKGPAPMQTAERDQVNQRSAELARELGIEAELPRVSEAPPVPGGISQADMVKNFWSMGTGQPAAPNPAVGAALQGSAVLNARMARQEGRDPMAMLHSKKPPFKLRVEGRG